MTRSSYTIEGSLIKLTASTGSASKSFSGATGTYNVQVYVLPENDGRPVLDLYKGSTRIHSYTYPLGTGRISSYTVSNVALTQGETLKLVGFANAGAWARVDKIVLTPVSTSSTSTTTTSRSSSAFEVANSSGTSSSGMLSTQT